MLNDDLDIIKTAFQWLSEKNTCHVYLLTVINTWGSSPRPPGSLMLVHENGVYRGSVSGGCIETDIIKRFENSSSKDTFPDIYTYGTTREESHRFGLPCGGQVEILAEKLISAAQVKPLMQALENHTSLVRHVCLNTGEVSLNNTGCDKPLIADRHSVRKLFGPTWKMLIIGAGHLSEQVSRLAVSLDYRVIVCDPRKSRATHWKLDHCEHDSCMPDDFIKKHVTNNRCIVLALTHEPNLDDMALMEALDSDAFYVGSLGSQTTNDNRRKRLKALGVTQKGINRLHGPVGLPIGSHTPAEIAVSILAEITAEKNNRKLVLSSSPVRPTMYGIK